VASIQARTADATKPTVYYAPGPNATTTVGNGNITTASIQEAGGANIAAQHGIGASQYATLTAVRDHHVYACPAGVFAWCASSSEAALQPTWLAKTLHPELFTGLYVENSTREFYSTFYRYRLSAAQLDSIMSGSD
jgi:iron complex transport system substrate-binding protein